MKEDTTMVGFLLTIFLLLDPLNPPIKPYDIYTWDKKVEVFENKNCAETQSCDLKKFSLITENYWLVFSDYSSSFGTRMSAEYETASLETMEKYGFVQFVRGCVFGSDKMPDGTIKNWYGYGREIFYELKNFCFRDWMIDSGNRDPFWENRRYGDESSAPYRHFFYRWNAIDGSYDRTTEKKYGEEKPHIPKLYIADRPGTAFIMNDYAKNISLEFKTCIYKTADIPTETTADNVNFAKPIHCFNWKSSFIYNHDLRIFETKDELDPFYLEEIKPEQK